MSGVMNMLLGARTTIAAAVDAFFNQVTLLLPGDGTNGAQNNTFLDSSTNNFTITRNDNTTQGTFTPFSQTGWSNFASAASGSVGFSNSTAALVSSTTSTFTAECWIYMTEAPVSGDGVPALIGMDATFNSSIFLGFGPNASRNLVLRWFDGASKTATGSTALALNTWHHIAVVANSNALAMYVNGVAETLSGTTTLTNRNSTTNTFSLFLNSSSSNYQFRGYASNIRVCTSAVYTGAFTPSTSPLTTTSQGATNCRLLTAQDNRFIDNSSNAFALTVQGSPSIQAFSPFLPTIPYSAATVGGSGYFDGTGDTLVTPTIGTSIGTGDFCLEGWVYTGSAASTFQAFIQLNVSSGYHLYLQTSGNQARFLDFQNPGTNFTIAGGTVNNNSWTHIVGTRQSGTIRLFVGGVLVANQTGVTFNYGTAGTAIIASTIAEYLSGIRITIGSVPTEYQTSSTTNGTQIFAVPTAPPTAVTNTQLLLNFTNAGIIDATAKNDLETLGNAQISTTQSKFGGSSIAFDGTGDYLTTKSPTADLFAFGSGDFTIEMWVRFGALPSAGNYNVFYDSRPFGGATSTNPMISLKGSTIVYYANAADRITSGTVSTGQWYHLAVSRSGTSTRMFLDGTQAGSTYTDSTVYTNTANRPYIGGDSSQDAGSFNGFIDDLRITKGFARYATGTGANSGQMVFNGTNTLALPTAAFPLQ